MNKKVLIVEDQFVEANDLQIMLEKAGYEVCGIARSVPIAQEIIRKEKPGLVLLDIFLKGDLTGIDLGRELTEENIAFIYLSANSNQEILAAAKTTEPYGFIVKPFREKDLLITLEIAQYRHEHSREARYRREAGLVQQLERAATASTSWKEQMLETGTILQQEIPFDYLTIGLENTESAVSYLRIGFNEYQTIGIKELTTITGLTSDELARITGNGRETEAAIFNNEDFEKIAKKAPLKRLIEETFHMRSLLSFPLRPEDRETSNLCFYSRRPDTYTTEHIAILGRLQSTLSKILEQAQVENLSAVSKNTPKRPAAPAPGNAETGSRGFDGIIGNSHLLLNVFDQIAQVAPFDTSVLILGESGTGKERIADSIHNLSSRARKPLVKVNCATLPATLIESELFGHEKGSFTGAMEKRTGKFEQANGGTIFLDEIGEMPVDLQVKLLRVLQEKEIEPVGGRSPIKVDVRVIAATNRNLEREVAEGRFRLDLYYRLNVFPITLPSLRERIEDIPALAQHFLNVFNRKAGKKITGFSDRTLKNMMAYSWPGNIRELEHLIERGVLMARSTVIDDLPLPVVHRKEVPIETPNYHMKTIHENERDYIIEVLKRCNGKIWGAGGAAEVLKVPPSTLRSKMKKLGIKKEY
jgi:DNA-binding NtrC family response regulator